MHKMSRCPVCTSMECGLVCRIKLDFRDEETLPEQDPREWQIDSVEVQDK